MGKMNISIFSFLLVMLIASTGLFQVDGLNCCADSHIGRCIPGSEDDTKCDNICKQNCKGGHCKIIGKTPPNHFCHCLC
uniref:Knottin scorpion toxin-like domain-containing protein n=1 Tax=Solanum lycopersicum TaxID=4081 RepID=A0A3Q7H914_SOLLC